MFNVAALGQVAGLLFKSDRNLRIKPAKRVTAFDNFRIVGFITVSPMSF